mmetsp:Transcript_14485/g.15661  ORF Transcript_14485/g.15661 Transcript_14485/m.15661 type:complete len:248 (-) Transcript_14485:19-762(-)
MSQRKDNILILGKNLLSSYKVFQTLTFSLNELSFIFSEDLVCISQKSKGLNFHLIAGFSDHKVYREEEIQELLQTKLRVEEKIMVFDEILFVLDGNQIDDFQSQLLTFYKLLVQNGSNLHGTQKIHFIVVYPEPTQQDFRTAEEIRSRLKANLPTLVDFDLSLISNDDWKSLLPITNKYNGLHVPILSKKSLLNSSKVYILLFLFACLVFLLVTVIQLRQVNADYKLLEENLKSFKILLEASKQHRI